MHDIDPALQLRIRCDSGERVSETEALALLAQSPLMARLLVPPKARLDLFTGVRALEWRLLELCETPFAECLPQVQSWLDLLLEKTVIPQGFSLEGTAAGVVACHMAMLTRIVIRLRPQAREPIDNGIQWILDFQNLERGQPCAWPGKDLYTRWGGCMKNTPCYYGIVKAMVTLSEYQQQFGADAAVADKLARGLAVILSHNVYQRRTTGEPIEPSITQLFFPYTYKTNLIELLTLLKQHDLLADERCAMALAILREKQGKDGFWKPEVSFMKAAWVEFEPLRKPGGWVTHMCSQVFD
jgi:hypothetical protein